MCGLVENPLQISWASGEPSAASCVATCVAKSAELDKKPLAEESRESDYEAVTLMRLVQAQQRKKLAEEADEHEVVHIIDHTS